MLSRKNQEQQVTSKFQSSIDSAFVIYTLIASLSLNNIRCYEQQSQQRQQSARIQIEKWKKGEELNKEVLIASSKCMERPKYVDPGK